MNEAARVDDLLFNCLGDGAPEHKGAEELGEERDDYGLPVGDSPRCHRGSKGVGLPHRLRQETSSHRA